MEQFLFYGGQKVLFLINLIIVNYFHFLEADVIPFTATFFSSLFFSLEYGIIIGVIINVFFILYSVARPQIQIDKDEVGNFLVIPMKDIHYPAAEYFREKILKECNLEGSVVIINGINILSIDTTVAKVKKIITLNILF